MTQTATLIKELNRLQASLETYQDDPGSCFGSSTHAAAMRASLDLSKALTRWRRAPKPITGVK